MNKIFCNAKECPIKSTCNEYIENVNIDKETTYAVCPLIEQCINIKNQGDNYNV